MRLVPLFLLCILSQVLAQSVKTPAAASSSASSTAATASVPSSSAPAASNTSVATAASSVVNAVSSTSVAAAPSTVAPAPAPSSTSWSLAQPLSTPSTGVQIPPVISAAAENIRPFSVAYLAVIYALFMLVA
ncbi:hypothetical protein BC943DRAFT_313444 [Umbelopsis sp. AD052]|nr:hypothetical protein BC943DRAFT_313444 [Umbelopsis sp. AD052]